MKLRVHDDNSYPGAYPYTGHVCGIQPVPPSEYEESAESPFIFITLTLTTEQNEDVGKGYNRWKYNGTVLELLPEEYWVLPVEEIIEEPVE